MAERLYGGGYGVHVSPLAKAVANSKSGGNDVTANRASTSPSTGPKKAGSGMDEASTIADPSAKEVAEMQAAAAAGDKDAIDWLKTAGIAIGAAAVGGGGLLARQLYKKRSLKNMGASDVGNTAAAPNAASTTSKKALPKPVAAIEGGEMKLLPAPAKQLTFNPAVATDNEAERMAPYYEQRAARGKANAAAKEAPLQYQAAYAARKARAVAKALARGVR